MKSYRTNGDGLDRLAIVERERPRARAGEVVLRMKAASVNYVDLQIARGEFGAPRPALVPLSDGVGEVVEVGAGVERVAVGDRVATIFEQGWISGPLLPAYPATHLGNRLDGVLAEYVALDARGVVRVPDHLTDEEAATLTCAGVTAWNALFEMGDVRAGDTVLVLGTGGVSIFALQFARLAGARVLVVSSSDEKLARAAELGAAAGLNYRTTADWERWAVELTGGAGVDHVVEVGGPATLGRSLKAVRMGGAISLLGTVTGVEGVIPTADIFFKNVRVLGIHVGSREMFEHMTRAIAVHQLRPVVDRVFPFEQAADAYRHVESGTHFAKTVIRIAA
ncbi:MAG TPA: NAD(P)-dependent alcohol dehydrogenase [Gemmatimonadaceae bacterium]